MPGHERFKCQELCLCDGLTGKEEQKFFAKSSKCCQSGQARIASCCGRPINDLLAEDRQCCNGMEVCRRSILRNIEPRDRVIDVRRTVPLTRSGLPGVEKDDVEVTVAGNRLMIAAEREFAEADEKEEFYRHELGYGKLTRTVELPDEVDPDNVHAELKDGILKVTLPIIRAAERHTVKVA